MAQTAFNIDENLMAFLERYEALGFTDQSEVVCIALERLKDEMAIAEDHTDSSSSETSGSQTT